MTNMNVRILNDVTKTLIDSQKGYQTCGQVSDKTFFLHDQFEQRAQARKRLVQDFQNQVRAYGEAPVSRGSGSGSIHRDFSKFSSLFRSDQKAALEAIDDGEEHLAQKIEHEMNAYSLDAPTRNLLQRAYTAAKAGERWAVQAKR